MEHTILYVQINTSISPWTLYIEDALLQHLDQETFYFKISHMDI